MDHRSYGDAPLFSNSAYDFGVSVGSGGSGNCDYGPLPCILELPRLLREKGWEQKVLWTGGALQATLLRLSPGQCLGPERQLHLDRFLYVFSGSGLLAMGSQAGNLKFREAVGPGCGILIPAGTWLSLSPAGREPLLLVLLTAPLPLSGTAVPLLEDETGSGEAPKDRF